MIARRPLTAINFYREMTTGKPWQSLRMGGSVSTDLTLMCGGRRMLRSVDYGGWQCQESEDNWAVSVVGPTESTEHTTGLWLLYWVCGSSCTAQYNTLTTPQSLPPVITEYLRATFQTARLRSDVSWCWWMSTQLTIPAYLEIYGNNSIVVVRSPRIRNDN